MQLGIGWSHLSAKSDTTHLEYSGTGASVGVALGHVVWPNLSVYGAFLLASASDPTSKVNGTDMGPTAGRTNLILFGPGVAYYLEPFNAFVAATGGVAKLDLEDGQGNVLRESKWRIGGELLIGKEWWVAEQWGIGVSGQMLLATGTGRNPLVTGEPQPTWNATAFSILFSATYN